MYNGALDYGLEVRDKTSRVRGDYQRSVGVLVAGLFQERKDEDKMDNMLISFLDFMYNDVLVDADVFEKINSYIKRHYGVPAPGGMLSTYRKWHTDELGDDDE